MSDYNNFDDDDKQHRNDDTHSHVPTIAHKQQPQQHRPSLFEGSSVQRTRREQQHRSSLFQRASVQRTHQRHPAAPPPPPSPRRPHMPMPGNTQDNRRAQRRPSAFNINSTFYDVYDSPDNDMPTSMPRVVAPHTITDNKRVQQQHKRNLQFLNDTQDMRHVEAIRHQTDYLVAHSIMTEPWSKGSLWYSPFFHSHALVAVLVALVSITIVVFLVPMGVTTMLSTWMGQLARPFSAQKLAPPPAVGDYHLQAVPSLTADEIDMILFSYDSPATGTGASWIAAGETHGIDPAFAVAFFIHESSAGTHTQWAGNKDDGTTTHNIGNIICAGYPRCYGRFRDYGSWDEGIEDWFRLIDTEYIHGRGTRTVDDIIPIYAPAVENDVNSYIAVVKHMVDSWRQNGVRGRGLAAYQAKPFGNPLQNKHTVMTQGYGVGSHAPAQTWGAVDLAIDSNNDGTADPDGSWGTPIHATHTGIARTRRNTLPAGNHIWLINPSYKTGYAHLQDFAVQDGQLVQPGDVIGYVGSTGQSSGPHLDYQVWQRIDNQWVNINPETCDVLAQ